MTYMEHAIINGIDLDEEDVNNALDSYRRFCILKNKTPVLQLTSVFYNTFDGMCASVLLYIALAEKYEFTGSHVKIDERFVVEIADDVVLVFDTSSLALFHSASAERFHVVCKALMCIPSCVKRLKYAMSLIKLSDPNRLAEAEWLAISYILVTDCSDGEFVLNTETIDDGRGIGNIRNSSSIYSKSNMSIDIVVVPDSGGLQIYSIDNIHNSIINISVQSNGLTASAATDISTLLRYFEKYGITDVPSAVKELDRLFVLCDNPLWASGISGMVKYELT